MTGQLQISMESCKNKAVLHFFPFMVCCFLFLSLFSGLSYCIFLFAILAFTQLMVWSNEMLVRHALLVCNPFKWSSGLLKGKQLIDTQHRDRQLMGKRTDLRGLELATWN